MNRALMIWLSFVWLLVNNLYGALAGELSTTGAYSCLGYDNSAIEVTNFTFSYIEGDNSVNYTVDAISDAQVNVTAYGEVVVNNYVNLCEDGVSELCPVPKGSFSRHGIHNVPTKYTSKISAIAYNIPDLEGDVKITLFNSSDSSQNLGCFQSSITNGKSTSLSSVKYATLGLAALALVVSGLSATSSNSGPTVGAGAGTAGATKAGGLAAAGNIAAPGFHPPSFGELFSAMQGIAVSGMYSLNYPSVYRSFTQNLGWSTGMITWQGMQTSIDKFRNDTGGNLTLSNYLLLEDTTLVYQNESSPVSSNSLLSRSISGNNNNINNNRDSVSLYTRQLIEHWKRDSITNDTSSSLSSTDSKVAVVGGITAYVEKLTIPDTNTFMTLLIWYAILMAVILAAILSFKLFVEVKHVRYLAKHKKESTFFPDFKKSYLLVLMTMLVRLIIIFYGIWVLYSLFQFKIGDSWGTRLLAGLTLGLFSLVLLLFSARIVYLAHNASKKKGGLEHLFEHEPWIRKYGVFYDQYKIRFWWFFIPFLAATFGRNAFLALGEGNGLLQVVGQLVIEVLLLAAMAILMPFNTRWGNGINLAIQGVRVASLILLLTFTKQIDISDIASTGVGFALIVIQAMLTITLIILLLLSALVSLFKVIRKQRKSSGKSNNDSVDEGDSGLQLRSGEEGDDDSHCEFRQHNLEYNQGSLMRMFSKNSQNSLMNEKDQTTVTGATDSTSSPGTSDSSYGRQQQDDDRFYPYNLNDGKHEILKDSPSRMSFVSRNAHENDQALRASVVGELPSAQFTRTGRSLSHHSVDSSGQNSFTWETDSVSRQNSGAHYFSIEASSPAISNNGSVAGDELVSSRRANSSIKDDEDNSNVRLGFF